MSVLVCTVDVAKTRNANEAVCPDSRILDQSVRNGLWGVQLNGFRFCHNVGQCRERPFPLASAAPKADG